jgi:proteasome accessory factor B
VGFGYRTSQGALSVRDVDAYGVVFRGGHWYLVGHDRERGEIRAFRLSRCTSELRDAGEGSVPPEGFRAADHVEAGPWVPRGDERAVVAFTPAAAVRAMASFSGAVTERVADDGRSVVSFPSADEAAVASLLLEYGPEAEVLEPEGLRDEIVRRLVAADA